MRTVIYILISVPLFASAFACRDDKSSQTNSTPVRQKTSKTAPPPASEPARPATPQPAAVKLKDPLRGTVKETMASGGYTYLRLATDQGEVWAAARQFTVPVGAEVEVAGLMPMRGFQSKTLNRTFEEIQFVSSARVVGDSAIAKPATKPPAGTMPAGHPPVAGAPKSQKPGAVQKLPEGVTVAELFSRKADLSGKPVKFRGRVVKLNRGIMGKNWLHIQDGTGEPGSNDITVTSPDGFAAVGSLVVIEGTLALDQDFGAGYTYAVIVEKAKVTIEPPKSDAPQPAPTEPDEPETESESKDDAKQDNP